MLLEYNIKYSAENSYEDWVNNAHWQFLITPEQNASQEPLAVEFNNSLQIEHENSINGYGFKTIRVHQKNKFAKISFEASFKLIKKEMNPFNFLPEKDISLAYKNINQLAFKVNHESFLKKTDYTTLPKKSNSIFQFDKSTSIFDNLKTLNEWVFKHILFKTDVTNVNTTLDEIIEKKHGVCQDFTHLFCAIARQNSIPTRYVSGYLHQGNGYFGDSQMHAWAEAYVPNIGWVGLDPTNNLLANENHIKVAHGKDYFDCSPLKGIIHTEGKNKTKHLVEVTRQQQQ